MTPDTVFNRGFWIFTLLSFALAVIIGLGLDLSFNKALTFVPEIWVTVGFTTAMFLIGQLVLNTAVVKKWSPKILLIYLFSEIFIKISLLIGYMVALIHFLRMDPPELVVSFILAFVVLYILRIFFLTRILKTMYQTSMEQKQP